MSTKRSASKETDSAIRVSKMPRKHSPGAPVTSTAEAAVQTRHGQHWPTLQWMDGASERRRVEVFLDYKSEHPLPWYALTKVPRTTFWTPISREEHMLTNQEVVLGLWTTGPITRIAIYSGLADSATRTQLTVQLVRQQDRDGLQSLHASGLLSTAAKIENINADKVNFVVREENIAVLENVYDARVEFQAKALMATLNPSRLKLGDVVLVESVAVRTTKASTWSIALHAYAVSLLARKPVATAPSRSHITSAPTVTFEGVL